LYSWLFAGAGGEPTTPFTVNAAPAAKTSPTTTDATINVKRDTVILLGLRYPLRPVTEG
jgi:hypothetical protein